MILKNTNQIFFSSKKNILILLGVLFFAIHKLFFLETFKINYPYAADTSDVVRPLFYFITENQFTFFDSKAGHIIAFPKILSYPNLLLNSFDVGNLFYLQWIIILLTVFVIYLILKQTDKNLFWTLIPISAFLFSPLTTSAYWSAAILAWLFPMLGIVLVIYFLNKKILKIPTFCSGVFFAIFSSFSLTIGIISWVTGLVMISKDISRKKIPNKKWLFLWIISTIIVGFSFTIITENDDAPVFWDLLFSYTSYSFIAHFLASSFRLKFDYLMISVGTISLVLSGIYLIYFIKSNYLRQYFAWFVLLLTAFFGGVLTALGRMQYIDTHFGNDPYYTTISQLFQIGLIVLTGKIIYEFQKSPKSNVKKIVKYLLIAVIISQMILLIPSYYVGWERGQYYFDEKNDAFSCFSLSPQDNCDYTKFSSKNLILANYLLEKNYSIFNEEKFYEKNLLSIEKYENIVDQNLVIKNGEILYINGKNIIDNSNITFEEEFIQIEGMIETEFPSSLESIFLIVDDKPLIEYADFIINDTNGDGVSEVYWSIFLLSGYFEDGCHSLKIVEIFNEEKMHMDDEITICK